MIHFILMLSLTIMALAIGVCLMAVVEGTFFARPGSGTGYDWN